MYFKDLLPRLVREGDDGNYGSTAVCDTICLQVCASNQLDSAVRILFALLLDKALRF